MMGSYITELHTHECGEPVPPELLNIISNEPWTYDLAQNYYLDSSNKAKQEMTHGSLLKISGHAKSHYITYIILNQEDTTNVTLSGVVNHTKNPSRSKFQIIVWRLKGERTERLKLRLLIDKIKCFMLLMNHRQNTSVWESPRIEPPFLPFDEPNLCNDCIFIDQELP